MEYKYWIFHRINTRQAYLSRESVYGVIEWADYSGGWSGNNQEDLNYFIEMAQEEINSIVIPLNEFTAISHLDHSSKKQYLTVMKEKFYEEVLSNE